MLLLGLSLCLLAPPESVSTATFPERDPAAELTGQLQRTLLLRSRGFRLYTSGVTNKTLVKPVLMLKDDSGGVSLIVQAKEGQLLWDWRTRKLSLLVDEAVVTNGDGTRTYFERRPCEIPWEVEQGR